MTVAKQNTVLFLCTGNYYRSRFAEHYFNALAVKEGNHWRSDSRGLAVGRSGTNVGPMSVFTLRALERLGIGLETPLRFPRQVVEADLHQAAVIVALKEAEHRSLLEEQFPAWTDRVEYWHVHDLDCALPHAALAEIQERIRALLHRLQTNGQSK